MTTQTKAITADDLLQMADDGWRYELLEGELRQMAPPGFEHAGIAADLCTSLNYYVREQGLGKVFVEGGFLLAQNPDTLLAPDIAFVRQDRLVTADPHRVYWVGAPDLAVEIVSPNDRYSEVGEKVARWLAAGTRLVWVVDPRRQQVAVYQAPTAVTILTLADTLEGGSVLPEWTLPVRNLFT